MNNKKHLEMMKELLKITEKHNKMYEKVLEKVVDYLYAFSKKHDLENTQIVWTKKVKKELNDSLKELFSPIIKNETKMFKESLLLLSLSLLQDLNSEEVEEEVEEIIDSPDAEGIRDEDRLSFTFGLFLLTTIGLFRSLNNGDINRKDYKTEKVALVVNRMKKLFDNRKDKISVYYNASFAKVYLNLISVGREEDEEYEWKAFPQCCPKCKALNGKVDTINGFLKRGNGYYPIHPRCRCILVPI